MFIRFDRIHERDRRTDGWMDGQTPHDGIGRACIDVDVDVERKQAQAIASLPDSITHAYSNEDFTVISLRLPVP